MSQGCLWSSPLQVFASRTGTRRSLDLFRRWGWHLLVSSRGVLRTEGFLYSIDNGAWTAHQRGEPFCEQSYLRSVSLLGRDAQWIVLPDVVGDAPATEAMARAWAPRLSGHRLMFVLQDGVTSAAVRRIHSEFGLHGVFIGGSSIWKDSAIRPWADWVASEGMICHVGRVNTRNRLALCVAAGVDSVDGSGVSRFTSHAIAFRRWCVELGAV